MKKKSKVFVCLALVLALCVSMAVPAFAAGPVFSGASSSTTGSEVEGKSITASLDKVVTPIVELLNSLLKPLLAIVVAVGSLYCVILGVKYSKAEEPQDREKAKQHLKNAIIGFVIIFILILALNILKQPLIDWVNANAGKTVIS